LPVPVGQHAALLARAVREDRAGRARRRSAPGHGAQARQPRRRDRAAAAPGAAGAHRAGVGADLRRRGAVRGRAPGRGHVRPPAGPGRGPDRRAAAPGARQLPRRGLADPLRPHPGPRALRRADPGPAHRRGAGGDRRRRSRPRGLSLHAAARAARVPRARRRRRGRRSPAAGAIIPVPVPPPHRRTDTVAIHPQQRERIASGKGFIAALDQSGGSTPRALKLYGVDESAYSNEEEMFAQVHAMRARIVGSPAFDQRILGAILFERTMDGEFAGKNAVAYLWEDKGVVPFLKIDKGLADEADGVQVMKPMPGLADLLERARARGVFGTKERSVIKANNAKGIAAVLDQQFEVARQVVAAGLVPIIEPEVDIKAADKAQIEVALKQGLLERLDALDPSGPVMLKLTLPEVDGFFKELVEHPVVLRVVALSGGYSRDEANARLARNPGVIASFSRALTEGLTAQQSDDECNKALAASIESIYQASIT